ncbi:DGCR14 [Cordylochernes scorpioides]|uniref:DGCR14 n=1 Tax=Cordylochernes scorpioides TaxID=51811 RepID=A0ABY6KV31_9ARAC|nr:DGCR14 [Cordylochernes scorpioides]
MDLIENTPNDKLIKKDNTPPVKTKSKQIILEEEDYTNALEKIIVRDFFPDLGSENVHQNIVPSTISSEYETPLPLNPKSFETPSASDIIENRLAEDDNVKSHVQKEAEKISLNKFLEKYTSEDNASFEVIQEKNEKAHKQKYPWLYNDEKAENEKVQNMIEYKEDKDQPATLTWKYKNKNSLMYIPDGAELTMEEKVKQITKKQLTIYKNTRLDKNPFNENANQNLIGELANAQARRKEGKVGVDGKEFCPRESPKVNGYGFVPSTPVLTPGASPLMTWGEIESTPAPLEREMTPGPQFRIPDVPLREKLALSLAADNRKKQSNKKDKAMEDMRNRLTSPRTPLLESLSPAAQRLATSKLGIKRGRDSALIASYTPSPQRISSPSSSPSLTDGLLNLPNKRNKAMDFF